MANLNTINANDNVIKDPFVEQALREIYNDYGDLVSVKNKAKNLLKFGRNRSVTSDITGSTIMTLAGMENNETYISDNLINVVSSSNAGDNQNIIIEGHTIDSNGDFTFVVQSVNLNGHNKVFLATPLARCVRMYNNGSQNLLGAIYAYQDQAIIAGVPQTANKVHCIINATKNQSEKCSTTISKNDYWLITFFTGTILEKTPIFADIQLQIRLKNKTFRDRVIIGLESGKNVIQVMKPYLVVSPNSDVRLVAVASASMSDIAGSIQGYLASKI